MSAYHAGKQASPETHALTAPCLLSASSALTFTPVYPSLQLLPQLSSVALQGQTVSYQGISEIGDDRGPAAISFLLPQPGPSSCLWRGMFLFPGELRSHLSTVPAVILSGCLCHVLCCQAESPPLTQPKSTVLPRDSDPVGSTHSPQTHTQGPAEGKQVWP